MLVLNPDVVFLLENNNEVTMLNRITNIKYSIGIDEYRFLQCFTKDGYIESPSLVAWCEVNQKMATEAFLNNGILVSSSKRIVTRSNVPFELTRIKLFEIHTSSQNIIRLSKREKFAPIYISAVLIILFTIALFCFLLLEIRNNISLGIITSEITESLNARTIVLIYLLELLSLSLHEIGHLIASKYVCGMCGNVGIMLFFLQPTIYCNISEVRLIDRKRQNIVYFSGVLAQLLLSTVSIMMSYFYFVIAKTVLWPLIYYAVANAFIAFLNLYPFAQFDGYYILSNIVGINNLYGRAKSYWSNIFLRRNNNENNLFVKVYGIISALSRIFIWCGALWTIIMLISNFINNR